jgi:hypothetical protein
MILAKVDGFYALANEHDASLLMDIMSRARKVEESFWLSGSNRFHYSDEATTLTISMHDFEPITEKDALQMIEAARAKREQERLQEQAE